MVFMILSSTGGVSVNCMGIFTRPGMTAGSFEIVKFMVCQLSGCPAAAFIMGFKVVFYFRRSYLDATDQLILYPLCKLQIVFGKSCKLLLDPPFDDVPLSFYCFHFVPAFFLSTLFTENHLQVLCRKCPQKILSESFKLFALPCFELQNFPAVHLQTAC